MVVEQCGYICSRFAPVGKAVEWGLSCRYKWLGPLNGNGIFIPLGVKAVFLEKPI
jgi:hypothetical protein